jgi:hypothetical protein
MAKLSKSVSINIEKVNKFMMTNPINQVFVLEAISRYAKQCADNEVDLIESMKHSMISGEAWVRSAKAWNQINS